MNKQEISDDEELLIEACRLFKEYYTQSPPQERMMKPLASVVLKHLLQCMGVTKNNLLNYFA